MASSPVTTDVLVDHVSWSIREAEGERSKLPPEILTLEGMSSDRVCHFLNNVCSTKGCRYLEIGVWKGATFISALHGNGSAITRAVAIDDFSQFGGPAAEFNRNLEQYAAGSDH